MQTVSIPQPMIRIGHKALAAGSGGTRDHLHPVSGERIATIPLAGEKEIQQAVAAAQAAQEGWRRLAPEGRRDCLNRLADLIESNAERFGELGALDSGMTVQMGVYSAHLATSWFRYYAGWCDKLDGQNFSTFDTRGEFSYSMPEPYGVIGVINTWNGPLIGIGMKVAPALAAGNCVLLKPAEITPFAPDFFAQLAMEAGVPDGVLSLVQGGPEAGEALVRHRHVEKISFTGGPIAARKIMAACAEQIKPSVMELGGKSASLMFPDCDFEAACQLAVRMTIGVLSGQGCALPTRLLIHADIYDKAVARIVEIAKSYKVGDPFDPDVAVGPLINAAACDRVAGMLDRVKSGNTGRIILGGDRAGGDLAGRNFIEPTIIVNADPDAEISQVEIFGPALCIYKFSDEDEAVRIANNTEYGLAAYIQSNDLRRVHRLAERLKAGGVYVNGGTQIHPHTPFGGLGLSGFGKEGGRAGIDEFIRYKTVAIGHG